MKSRGVYETPGGTVLFHMRRAIESLTLDKGACHLKDELMPKYAELVYNGFWFGPERKHSRRPSTRPGTRDRRREGEALQGQCDRHRTEIAEQFVFGRNSDFRGRRRIRPKGRRRIHKAQRLAATSGEGVYDKIDKA